MRTSAILAATASLVLTTTLPAMTTPAEAKNKGAKVAAGVVLGAAALAIIASQSKANAGDYNEGRSGRSGRSGFWRTCEKWYSQCSNGNDYACEKYETRGCTE